MQITAKRLLFIFGVLSLLNLWSPIAVAKYTVPLDQLFQSPTYSQGLPGYVHFQHTEGSMGPTTSYTRSLFYDPAVNGFQDASSALNPLPASLFKALLAAIEEADWELGNYSNQMLFFVCYSSDLSLSFKLKDGPSFTLYSRAYAPTQDSERNIDGPWVIQLDYYSFETSNSNIGKALLKIYQQLRPDLNSPDL